MSSAISYDEILELQRELNESLCAKYHGEKQKGREYLSKVLIEYVEELVERLNKKGHRFGRCEYGGDVRFEHSEQFFSNGEQAGEGVILHFLGFSVQVSCTVDAGVA